MIGADERSLAGVTGRLERAGVDLAAVVDLRDRAPARIAASGRGGEVGAVTLDGRAIDCDLVVASGVRQPAYSLLAQAGARVEYDAGRGIFVPVELPSGVEAVGGAAGDRPDGPIPAATYAGEGSERCFVCTCEDVTDKDVARAVAEGYDSIELAKRYTTVTMGPCQGKLCQLASVRLLAQATATDAAAIGTTTARPPWTPVELGVLAGRHHEPMRRTPLHDRHEQAGARMIWTGTWRRPFDYGDDGCRGAQRARLGRHHRPLDARQDPRRGPRCRRAPRPPLPEPLQRPPAGTDPLRRAHHRRRADHGRRDRHPARGRALLPHDDLDRLRRRLRVDRVVERRLGLRRRDRERHGRARRRQRRRPAGARGAGAPHGRRRVGGLVPLPRRRVRSVSTGVPCLALRIGFVGELGYELHFTASRRRAPLGRVRRRAAHGRSGSSRSGSCASRRRT